MQMRCIADYVGYVDLEMTTKLVITGAGGFLGWHVRVLARAQGLPEPVLLHRNDLQDPQRFAGLADSADRLVHLAGVNRGTPAENVDLAKNAARGLQACATRPKTVVFANSSQCANGSAYGKAKAESAQLLAEAAGPSFVDLTLPSIFGEHARPHYHSVVATFCRMLADGGDLDVHQDRELELLHATDAAALLLGLPAERQPVRRTVGQLARQLSGLARVYREAQIPELEDDFAVRLFNTYRSHCFPGKPVSLSHWADRRGLLVETVRAHGRGGQTNISPTAPRMTRGDHYHLSKVERFVVLRGEAEVRLRRLLHHDVTRVRVSGSRPVAIDMPAMWTHSITNIGDRELLTLFWSHELFDPRRPDTYSEPVLR
jgi:UDP-2-acetamido-2,6-beta-L-arabino-hexul-4-ose reductase